MKTLLFLTVIIAAATIATESKAGDWSGVTASAMVCEGNTCTVVSNYQPRVELSVWYPGKNLRRTARSGWYLGKNLGRRAHGRWYPGTNLRRWRPVLFRRWR